LKKIIMTSGAIPIQLLRMKAQGTTVSLAKGLAFPDNIGHLGKGVTRLDPPVS
jgi:hypothetical protein